jgi:hypothetical protein
MSHCRIARKDPALSARIVRELEMTYADGPSDADDRPPHVRAASGLVAFKEYLAVIQDDANWLALIDEDDRVHALPLPPGPESGSRIFSKRRGNRNEKFDLEACIVVPGRDGAELIGFGSGSHRGREWILRVHEGEDMDAVLSGEARHALLEIDLKAEFLDAAWFYNALRATLEFAGAGLNIEGAVLIDDDTIRLFQRGNARPQGEQEAVDASGDISWRALAAHLADPAGVPPPSVRNIHRYDLGALDGVRLTFSDVEHLGDGRILYSASAEDPASDAIVGSALGVIEPDGRSRWTEVIDARGGRFEGKIEGLSLHRGHANLARFVVDDDDEDLPSVLFEAELSDAFLRGPGQTANW